MELIDPKSVDLIATPPRIGDLNICGACGKVNILAIDGTREITPEELSELTPDEKRDLHFAIRAAKQNFRN